VKVSRPGELHGAVCTNGVRLLSNYTFQRKKGYALSNDAGLVLERDPDTVRGPDISLYLDNRKLKELEKKWPKRLPKLIVEVMSPTDRMSKMLKRIAKFLKQGIAMAWLLDPEDETLTIFMPNKEPIVLERDEEVAGLKLLPDFHCKVAEFFVMPGE
jgi:Uma2 family endonuclease